MKPFRQYLNELRVGAAFKKGGIRGAVHALKANIKHRGVVGGSGVADSETLGIGGGAHSGVHDRIDREVASGKRSAASGERQHSRVSGHYQDKVNRENKKLGMKPAYPQRKTQY